MPGSDRFVRLPTELLESLLQVRLSGLQWRILFWVVRQTYGWNRNTAPFSWYRIATDLGINRGGVVRAGNRLLRCGILDLEAGHIGIRQDRTQWGSSRLTPREAMPDGIGDKRHLKAMPGDIATGDDWHRKRCQEASFLRRAKDSSKDRLKTYKDKRAHKTDDGRQRFQNGALSEHPPAGAARPIPGKYDSLSQN